MRGGWTASALRTDVACISGVFTARLNASWGRGQTTHLVTKRTVQVME